MEHMLDKVKHIETNIVYARLELIYNVKYGIGSRKSFLKTHTHTNMNPNKNETELVAAQWATTAAAEMAKADLKKPMKHCTK